MVVAVIEAETRWPRFQQRGQGGIWSLCLYIWHGWRTA